jgi:hypothetical protein
MGGLVETGAIRSHHLADDARFGDLAGPAQVLDGADSSSLRVRIDH